MEYILFTIVDPQNRKKNTKFDIHVNNIKYNYEHEAITCFKFWRKLNTNRLKDIEIVCINPYRENISIETKLEFDKLNITYIHKEFTNISNSNYDLVPVVGEWFERNYSNFKYILHIDLDMVLINQIPEKCLKVDENSVKVAGVSFREKGVTDHATTCYMISKPKACFYSKWLKYLKQELFENTFDYYDLAVTAEESVILDSKLCDEINIGLIYNIFTSYWDEDDIYNNFIPPSEYSKFKDICFIHSHEYTNILSKLLKNKEEIFR